MHCLSNTTRINYPKDLVYSITELYTFRGKDFYYEDVFKPVMGKIIKKTVIRDTIYASKILNLNVTETRLKNIATRDSEPRTKDETVVANLKKVFTVLQDKGMDFEITSNEIQKLAEMTFKDATTIHYKLDKVEHFDSLLATTETKSRRELMDQEFKLYDKAIRQDHIEVTQAITDLYIDMLKMDLFDSFNGFISLLTMYGLFFRARFNVFKYVSFFEQYHKQLENFRIATAAADYGWADGYSNTSSLNNILINVMLDGYEYIENEVSKKEIDKNLKKVETVESAIMKLDSVFTREQVVAACPHLSDSTITRAFTRLKNEGKIQPNGTGRSATWMKLVENEVLGGSKGQMSLFDLQEMNNYDGDK